MVGTLRRVQPPATETDNMAGSLEIRTRPKWQKLDFLELSEDGSGFTAQGCSQALQFPKVGGKVVGSRMCGHK